MKRGCVLVLGLLVLTRAVSNLTSTFLRLAEVNAFVTMGLQRSGTNLVRTFVNETFESYLHDVRFSRRGSLVRRYCYPCLKVDLQLSNNCTSRSNFETLMAVRNSPASPHFHVHEVEFHTNEGCGVPKTFKYSISQTQDIDKMYGKRLAYIVVVKDPISWLTSVAPFWKMNCYTMQSKCYELLSLWDDYYGKWFEMSRRAGSTVFFVRYEDVLDSHEQVLTTLAKRFNWVYRRVDGLTKKVIPISKNRNFDKKKLDNAAKRFIEASRFKPFDERDPLKWIRMHCEHLKHFFMLHTTYTRLGYNLDYLTSCSQYLRPHHLASTLPMR